MIESTSISAHIQRINKIEKSKKIFSSTFNKNQPIYMYVPVQSSQIIKKIIIIEKMTTTKKYI